MESDTDISFLCTDKVYQKRFDLRDEIIILLNRGVLGRQFDFMEIYSKGFSAFRNQSLFN